MNQLFVFFENKKVGTLQRNQNDLMYSFTYSKEWISDKDSFSLSLALPVSEQVYGNKLTLSFFENLLPEGDVRSALEKSQNLKGEFDFLNNYGKDFAGAITISSNEKYSFKKKKLNLQTLDLKKIYNAIEEKKSITSILLETQTGYLSLAGAQDKFSAIYQDNNFLLPIDGSPTTHIIKVPINRNGIKDSVYNELFCMQLAGLVGLKVPECFIHKGKFPLYVVERYDRIKDSNNQICRLHQQDFCQAQGFTSEFKYEIKGGPSLANNFSLIVDKVSFDKKNQAIEQFFNWICFNLIVGNNDAHSKNISLILKDKRIELAPIYDLLSTAIYPKLNKEFAFKVGNRNDF